VEKFGRSRGHNIEAFFRATFDAWKNYKRTGRETVYVGYSPIIIVDGEKILNELSDSHILHIVRNPWSAYADTKKRPVPLSLTVYTLCWNLNQYYALLLKEKFPHRMHLLRAEDVMSNSYEILGAICEKLDLEKSTALKNVSWNSLELSEVYPWGTIRQATAEANLATAQELSKEEKEEIRLRTWQYLEVFDYKNYI
jgi:hypothetical protein